MASWRKTTHTAGSTGYWWRTPCPDAPTYGRYHPLKIPLRHYTCAPVLPLLPLLQLRRSPTTRWPPTFATVTDWLPPGRCRDRTRVQLPDARTWTYGHDAVDVVPPGRFLVWRDRKLVTDLTGGLAFTFPYGTVTPTPPAHFTRTLPVAHVATPVDERDLHTTIWCSHGGVYRRSQR